MTEIMYPDILTPSLTWQEQFDRYQKKKEDKNKESREVRSEQVDPLNSKFCCTLPIKEIVPKQVLGSCCPFNSLQSEHDQNESGRQNPTKVS
jgi:hypothetical protein